MVLFITVKYNALSEFFSKIIWWVNTFVLLLHQ